MKDVLFLKEDIRECRRIQKKYGTSYYISTLFFPKEMRDATFVLYAFVRIPDEIVDSSSSKKETDIKKELLVWTERWERAYKDGNSTEPILRAAAILFKRYNIPYTYSQDFLSAMVSDTEKRKYKNYEELQQYMYGSAAVVGLMMSCIIGFSDKQALVYAEELGYAMQLTNFLRDIREDYDLRKRIYMPQDEMKQFGVLEIDIAEGHFDTHFVDFLKFQIARARAMFVQSSEKGIPLLNKRGRKAVKIAAVLYGAILDEIEKQNYNVYKKRARTSFLRKIFLVTRVIMTS